MIFIQLSGYRFSYEKHRKQYVIIKGLDERVFGMPP